MSLIRQFAGQSIIYGVGSILARVVNYLVIVVLLTYLLGDQTEEFGTYAYFYAYAAVLITLFSFRLDTALFRYGNKDHDLNAAFDTALSLVIPLALALALIGTLLSQPLAVLLDYPDHPHYVQWICWIIAFDVINLIPFAKLRLTNKAMHFALYKIINVVLLVSLTLFFLIVLPRSESLRSIIPEKKIVDWVFIANLMASAGLTLLLLPHLRSYRPRLDTALSRKMLRYAFPLVIVGMANAFIQFFGVPLQQFFLGADRLENLADAGVYDFTRRVAGLFVMFTTAFNYAAEPFFFNNSSPEDRKALYGKICRLFVLVGGLVALGIFLGIDLLKYLADNAYWDSLHLLPILLMAYLLLGIYYNVSIWYKLSDKTTYGAVISVIGVMVTLIVSIGLLPVIGTAASAWAALATYLVMVVLGYLLGQKHLPIDYPVKLICRDLLLIGTLMAAGQWIRAELGITTKYILYLLMLLLYAGYMWKSEEEEWRRVLRV